MLIAIIVPRENLRAMAIEVFFGCSFSTHWRIESNLSPHATQNLYLKIFA